MLWGISWLGFDICVFWLTVDLSGDSFADEDFTFFALDGANCRPSHYCLSFCNSFCWVNWIWMGTARLNCLFKSSFKWRKVFDDFFILVLMGGVSRRFYNISAILTFSFASLTISNACASSNSICFLKICSLFCDFTSICSASTFARVAVSGRTGTSTSNLVFFFLNFKGFTLMDLLYYGSFVMVV